jgi:hypothetical protein
MLLLGRRCDRVEQARAHDSRAEAVVEKTKNLLTLEAEQAYLRWKDAAVRARKLREAQESARDLHNSRWVSGPRPMNASTNVDRVLTDGLLAIDSEVQANRAE